MQNIEKEITKNNTSNGELYNSKYDQKLKSINDLFNIQLELQKTNKDKSKLVLSELKIAKELIFKEFSKVIEEIEIISNSVDKNNEIIEESPASKKSFMNLNWSPHVQVNGAFVDNNYEIKEGGSHWHVESDQVFSGALLCKIKLVQYTHNSNNWKCGIGLIRNNNNTIYQYYNHSIVMANDTLINTKFTGTDTKIRLFQNTIWKEGDEIIVKRDNSNDVYFGINDESSMVKGYDNIEGDFRIVIGFINFMEKNDIFELIYLKDLSLDSQLKSYHNFYYYYSLYNYITLILINIKIIYNQYN